MTQQKTGMLFSGGLMALAAFSLSLLWSTHTYAQTEGAGTVCILQVIATGNVMAVVVDDTRDIDLAVLVPPDNVTNLPIRCVDLDRIGLAVANQEAFQVTFNTHIYTNKGVLKCSKGPFNMEANGGRGVAFKDCV
jgi:hypothetical protein